MEFYNPKFIGFEHFLKLCRSPNTDCVDSTAKNGLQFKVQTHIAQNYNLMWTDSSTSNLM